MGARGLSSTANGRGARAKYGRDFFGEAGVIVMWPPEGEWLPTFLCDRWMGAPERWDDVTALFGGQLQLARAARAETLSSVAGRWIPEATLPHCHSLRSAGYARRANMLGYVAVNWHIPADGSGHWIADLGLRSTKCGRRLRCGEWAGSHLRELRAPGQTLSVRERPIDYRDSCMPVQMPA